MYILRSSNLELQTWNLEPVSGEGRVRELRAEAVGSGVVGTSAQGGASRRTRGRRQSATPTSQAPQCRGYGDDGGKSKLVLQFLQLDMLAGVEMLVRLVAVLFPEFKLMWLAEETKKNLPLELDFVNEGLNADRVRRMFIHESYLKVPEIYWEYTTDRVLTMEYCEGGQVNDLKYYEQHKIIPSDVSPHSFN